MIAELALVASQTCQAQTCKPVTYQATVIRPLESSQCLTTYTYLTPVTPDTVLFQRARPGRKTLGRLLKCK